MSKELPPLPVAKIKKRLAKTLPAKDQKDLERRASLMQTAAEKTARIQVLAVCGYATETIARLIGANVRDFEPGGIWFEVHQDAVCQVMEEVMASQIELAKQGDDKAADRLIRRHLVGFDKQPAAPGAPPIELHLSFGGAQEKTVNGRVGVIEGEAARLIAGNA